MKTNHKKFWSWQPAGLVALLLGAVVVLPVLAGTSDSKSPTTNQTAVANTTNTDTLVKVLPATLVGAASDTNAEFIILRAKAEKGDAQSQFEFGQVFYSGEFGEATNYLEAVKWFRKAAEQNDPRAQCKLGVCYGEGQGIAQNYVEAYKWLLLADAQGDELSKAALPKLESLLTPEQRAEGQKRAGEFKPLEVASLDVEQDVIDGNAPVDLLAKAETGNAKAQNELGEAFYAGRLDVMRDPVAAVKWFRKTAEQNLAAAQSNLGVCYERGDGVAKYEVEAYKWDLLAAAQEDAKAKSNATLFELMMSPEQIAEGKQRAQVWLKQQKPPPPAMSATAISSNLKPE